MIGLKKLVPKIWLLSYAFVKLLSLRKLDYVNVGSVIYRSAKWSDMDEVTELYRQLNGVGFSKFQKIILKINSGIEKILIVAEKKECNSSKIVGINFYYLNPRDIKERTIHEGFVGVLPESEGQGIATQMRKLANEHFKKSGFSGISTRISKKNLGSLRSAEKLGFKAVEEYFDSSVSEDRYYMVCNLRK